jgi:hypothetical protein
MFIVAFAEGVNTTAVVAVGTDPVLQNDVLLQVAGVPPIHVAWAAAGRAETTPIARQATPAANAKRFIAPP